MGFPSPSQVPTKRNRSSPVPPVGASSFPAAGVSGLVQGIAPPFPPSGIGYRELLASEEVRDLIAIIALLVFGAIFASFAV